MASSYQSDITCFLQELKAAQPDLEQRQRDGRARLWDKQLDSELIEGFRAARVPQRPYVYQND